MKAIQIQQFNTPYSVSDVPVPKPQSHQVLVKIKAAGFCHTDLMALENAFDSTLPFIASHEPAGVIEEVGDNVRNFAVGDRVGCLNFESVCNECPDCKAGRPIYCDKPLMKGLTTDGAMAEYMVADARFAIKLPESVDFAKAACLMCAGVSIFGGIKTAIRSAQLQPGASIGIIGIGGLGHMGTQLAKAMGYKVAAVDVKQSSLDLVNSHDLKPDISILATDPVESAMKKITESMPGPYPGLDAVVLTTDAPPAFEFAASITRKHGTMVLLGQPAKGITMSYHNVIFRDIKLVGSLLGDTSTAEELVKLVAEKDVKIKIKEWDIEQAEDMRKEYLEGKGDGKNVVVFK